MNERVIAYIEYKLRPMLKSGKHIGRLVLYVSRQADIAEDHIITKFGRLRVAVGEYIPKGYAYILEQPLSKGGLGFVWVTHPPQAIKEQSSS
ncbi:hypothetical protein PA598K_01355 [Paenibacillus sp. 598K]|nr:hypothetical protein PA598K_01355 [Paenibacillus sp. 598K]